ncbi:Protein phosphatase [Parasponia andersonii]|uniref:protein-serine/threonine phosphatase n=1 Tax=Parasponia andersonii TaxID=3476 RepID=A0A2P5DFG6_PARAD|nr:Protein phosphatase [Parasponia andersonii]
MALLSQQLQRFLLTKFMDCHSFKSTPNRSNVVTVKARIRTCSAIAIDTQSSPLADVAGIRWGSTSLQGPREEMEDDVVLRSDGLDGFSFAAVLDGHGGSSSVNFLRDELYKEFCTALQGGLLLTEKHFNAIREAIQEVFQKVDQKLLTWLELNGEEDESGSTATVIFIGNDKMFVSHVGDSCVVLSRSGEVEVLTNPHRPYGSNKVSLQEIRRIREAGGWIVNGRICGDIAVSRAFGDQRFKTKKNEMLTKGVEEGRWSEKFVSRVQFSGDLVTASPDVFQVALGTDAEFVLLASDGLWDYINSSEAVAFVRNQLRQHGDVQLASEKLAEAALDRRTQDNVSIVIADLGRTDWRNLPLQEQNLVYELGQALATIGIVSLGVWMTTLLS